MKLTKTQTKKIENFYDRDISEISEYEIESYFNFKNIPIWVGVVDKYSKDLSICWKEVKEIKTKDLVINVVDSETISKFYDLYFKQLSKIIRAITAIDFPYFRSFTCDFILDMEAVCKKNIKSIIDKLNKENPGCISSDANNFDYRLITTKKDKTLTIKDNLNIIFKEI